MAATLTVEGQIPGISGANLYFGTILMDNSYPTGGEAIDPPGDAEYQKMWITARGPVVAGQGVIATWDKANKKVVVYWGNAGSASVLPEVTATTDLSTTVFDFLAVGP